MRDTPKKPGNHIVSGLAKTHWRRVETLRAGILKQAGDPGYDPGAFLSEHTRLIDNLLKGIADTYSVQHSLSRRGFCLVAIGGYGRSEMAPYSDVDVMVLNQGRPVDEIELFVKELMYPLWDLGLEVGYSVRTIPECKQLIRQDITIYTALVDSRYLWGDGILYNRYKVEVPGKALRLHAEKSFFDLRKVTEKRHERYGKSVSLLEPNVKEGKGGLRDFHVLRWLLWPLEGVSNSWGRVAGDMITGRLSEDLQDALRFLWKIRLVLHMLVQRKNDRLTFQFQEEIALHLGYRQKGHTLDVEVFMRDYYEKATVISRAMALAFEKLSWKNKARGFSKLSPITRRVSRDFVLKHGKLEAVSSEVFTETPAMMIRAFQIAARYGVDVGWQTREYITRAMESSSRGIRTDAAALHAFLKIFKKGRRIADTLIQMNRIKLLGYLLPEFENIYCRVQHDAYHVYTVDVHSIFTVAEIEKLKDIRQGNADPLLRKIAGEINQPFLLFLAAFLHDIGKGSGKGHAVLGAKIVRSMSGRFGLSEAQKSLLVFLVENHLMMSEISQRRDLFEEKLIVTLANRIGSVETLKMLYVLTYADIRSVGKEAWNEWKGHLLRELFFKVLYVLEKGKGSEKEAARLMEQRLLGVKSRLKERGDPNGHLQKLLDSLPYRYLLQMTPDRIEKHLALLESQRRNPVVCDIEEDLQKGVSEIVVVTRDRHGLFSLIAGVMAANQMNILSADIHTTTEQIAIDLFRVNSPFEPSLKRSGIWDEFRRDLQGVLSGGIKLDKLIARQKDMVPAKRRKIRIQPPEVQIDNETSYFYTTLDVFAMDRVGLLYDITRIFSNLELDISLAKISTKVDRVADVFYVQDETGGKIMDRRKLDEIRARLEQTLKTQAP